MEEVIAHLYNKVYIVIVLLFTFQVLSRYVVTNGKCIEERISHQTTTLLCVFMILFIGFRPISAVFIDMLDYANAMIDHRYENVDYSENFIFVPFMAFLSSNGCPPRGSILILAVINLSISYVALRKLFPNNLQMAYLVFLGSFSTFMYATNGIKAGCAEAWLLCAVAYRDKLKYFIPLLIMAYGTHHSQLIMVVACTIAFFYKKPKYYVYAWIACLIISFLHIQYFQILFAGFTDEHGADYLTISEDSDFYVGSGFRIDFVLYSALPIAIGWYYLIKRKIEDKIYAFIFNSYIAGNAVWLLCMYANYSYRFAYLSWGLYPVLIIYPFIKNEVYFCLKTNKCFKYIVLLNAIFTAFLYFAKY